eukprot:scaffold45486_cov23-Cyclotella_meneghiniana.AAC.1
MYPQDPGSKADGSSSMPSLSLSMMPLDCELDDSSENPLCASLTLDVRLGTFTLRLGTEAPPRRVEGFEATEERVLGAITSSEWTVMATEEASNAAAIMQRRRSA